jgi:predicted extracellular nuclease
MIKCIITITETNKGFYVGVEPDQSAATPVERRVAGFMNLAMTDVANYLMSKGEKGEMIESYDANAIREIVRQKTKEFESGQ